MKKTIAAALIIFAPSLVAKAQVYISRTSLISFFSATPMENIKAENKAATSVLNTSSGDIVFKVPITSFKFESALMEEHFNENYLESAKYPFGTYKGAIQEKIDVYKEGVFPVTVSGIFNIHGVEKAEKVTGTLTVKDNKITIDAVFKIALEDYKIDIPKIVYEKIAEKIEVKVNAEYFPYTKK